VGVGNCGGILRVTHRGEHRGGYKVWDGPTCRLAPGGATTPFYFKDNAASYVPWYVSPVYVWTFDLNIVVDLRGLATN